MFSDMSIPSLLPDGHAIVRQKSVPVCRVEGYELCLELDITCIKRREFEEIEQTPRSFNLGKTLGTNIEIVVGCTSWVGEVMREEPATDITSGFEYFVRNI